MSYIKSVAKDWIPPVFLRKINNLRKAKIYFEGEYISWNDAAARCTGYDAANIISKVLSATMKVKSGEVAYERDSVLFDKIEYSWLVTAGLMWGAAFCGGRLSVLDFGGALGSSYFQNKKLLDTLGDVRWCIVEQSHYVDAGVEHIQDERIKFYKSVSQCLKYNRPNVILLSGVLQYVCDPQFVLSEVLKCGAVALLVDRTPFVNRLNDSIVIQRVPEEIYSASYPMRIFSWDLFIQQMCDNWEMISTFPSIDGCARTSVGLEFGFKGVFFKSKHAM